MLLKTEKHMVELYGRRGKCWSEFLKSCLKRGTVDLPTFGNKDLQQSIKERLKNLVKEPREAAKTVECNSVQKKQPRTASTSNVKPPNKAPPNETLHQPHQRAPVTSVPQGMNDSYGP